MPLALITGVTGQDGSYLAELLLAKGYEVHGLVRNANGLTGKLPAAAASRIQFHSGDLRDAASAARVLAEVAPDELYHLASQTQVGLSFAEPLETAEISGMAIVRLMDAARRLPRPPRIFHASSAQIFGRPTQVPQNEDTPIAPISPYGAAKAFGTQLARVYRDNHELFVVNGILFNHESPRRGPEFVPGKICHAAAAIKLGREQELMLGNTKSERDWGDARDFVEGFWRALQQDTPMDYVFATGRLHRVQDIVEAAFAAIGLDWRQHVRIDSKLFRPGEPPQLVGDPSRARRVLGWEPRTSFEELIAEMTKAAVERLEAGSRRQ
jgi:GDPmannose 4,6-dehydratase